MEKKIDIIKKGENNTSKSISRIRVKFKVSNVKGTFNITDIMLQTGDKSGIWNSHPSEVRWDFGN